ncbi:MAG: hypothetical protein PHN38_04170 [Sulfurospirillaceae bacterium]|nr:hypothetical protein [Sulfurospirillaceae bacterium]
MKAFFTGVFSFFIVLLEWLVKKIGIKAVVIGIQITAMTIYRAFLLVAMAFFLNFLFRFWVIFKDLAEDFNSLGLSVAGVSYGIANSQLVSSFWGFVHASGLDDAILTASSLFISLLAGYFAIQAYRIVAYVYKDVIDLINVLLALMTR